MRENEQQDGNETIIQEKIIRTETTWQKDRKIKKH